MMYTVALAVAVVCIVAISVMNVWWYDRNNHINLMWLKLNRELLNGWMELIAEMKRIHKELEEKHESR